MSVNYPPYNMDKIFPVDKANWLPTLRRHWNAIQLTEEFKCLAMWCLTHSFCSDKANMPICTRWMTSTTTGLVMYCNVSTMGNLLGKSEKDIQDTMMKLTKFDTTGMKALMSSWTLLEPAELNDLAASTVRELVSQMQETLGANSESSSCRKSEFERSLKSILGQLPFLAGLAWGDFDMEELFDGNEDVERETEGRARQWQKEVDNVHTLFHTAKKKDLFKF